MDGEVFLRAFQLDDHLLINKWRNDPEIQKMTCGNFRYVSLEIEKEWVKQVMMDNTKNIYLAICLNDETQTMIGYASINNINYINRVAECGGIVIGEKEYRDGEIKFLVSAKLREFVFDHLNMNRYTSNCLSGYKAPELMMLASGYKLEGIERQAIYKNGRYYDRKIFALLREEYYDYLEKGLYSFNEYLKAIRRLVKENK